MTESVEVRTGTGPVRGRWREFSGHRSAAFLGIPYAQPPVGALRCAAPVPPAAWHDVLDATRYGPTAKLDRGAQMTLVPEPSVPGDAILSMNVWTPDPAASLPVLVWIHGGGFTEGSPASPWYDGRAFNRDGVVTVTFGYRLGFEGFGHVPGAPANRAVLDWLLALEWVRENIGAFGGDPARITVGGQSAGGGAVLTLLGMPEAQHLFAQAYVSSPVRTGMSAAHAESIGRELAARGGVPFTVEGLSALDRRRLVALEADAGGRGAAKIHGMLGDGLPFRPVVDGLLIREPALDALAHGTGSDKPLLIGANDDEFALPSSALPRLLRLLPPGLVLGRLGARRPSRRAYLRANEGLRRGGTARAVGRYVTDLVFRSTVLTALQARTAGRTDRLPVAPPPGETRAELPAPSWAYRFAWPSPAQGARAVHCLDLPFLFDVLDDPAVPHLCGQEPPQALADEIHAAAVHFIAHGSAPWQPWGPAAPAHVFDTPSRDESGALASLRSLLPPDATAPYSRSARTAVP